MRTVYLGTSAFGAAVLERLMRSDHRPALVVSRPDRPRGRGRRLTSPPVAETARELGIDLIQPHSVNSEEARGLIAEARPEALLICAYGALIKEPLLSERELLNVHPSLLPRWRGAAPIERAIEAGDPETGVSVMRPTEHLDAGPVCLQRSEPILPDDDYGSLSRRLEALAGELLVEALDRRPPFREQPAAGVTIAVKIGPEDRRLSPADGARALERRVRSLSPHVGAYVELEDGERLQVLRARVADSGMGGERYSPGEHRSGGDRPAPGELRAAGDRLLLGCPDGALELLRVKAPGGREMDADAYLHGHWPRSAPGRRSSPQPRAGLRGHGAQQSSER